MSARCALSYLRDQGATVHLDGGDLVIEGIELSDAVVAHLRNIKAEIIAELSRSPTPTCWVCGSPHAPFGMGWSWRSAETAHWFCAKHRLEVETDGNNLAPAGGFFPAEPDQHPDWTTTPVPGWPHHLNIFDHIKCHVVRIRLKGGDR